ncbi:MAG: hypothetical protein JRN15_04990 [Nitrososphaerota archaeon]|nr:hypothetical protein [Nitrososphaerota archaeon]
MSNKRRATGAKASARRSKTSSRKGRRVKKNSGALTVKRTALSKNEKIDSRKPYVNFSKFEKVLGLLASEIKKLSANIEVLKTEQIDSLQEVSHAVKMLGGSKSHMKNQELTVPTMPKSENTLSPLSQDEHTRLEAEVAKSKRELERIQKEESASKTRLANLNAEFTELQKKAGALHNYYISQNQSLERELDARRKTIHQRIEGERTQAESEIMTLLRQRDAMRDEVRNLTDEKVSLRKEIEFARSLSSLIRNPDAISEAELAVLSDRFQQARVGRLNGSKSLSDAQTRAARQYLLSAIEKLSKA